MISNKWLKYGIITVVATVILVADVGLGMYAAKLAKKENPLGFFETTQSVLFRKPNPSPTPTPKQRPSFPTYDDFVSHFVGKEFTLITTGGLSLMSIDRPTAARMATTSSDTTIYKNGSSSEAVLYGILKAAKEDVVVLVQKNEEKTVSLTSPYYIFSREGEKLILLSFNDKNIQNALTHAPYPTNGAPAMLFGVKKNVGGWKANGMIVFR